MQCLEEMAVLFREQLTSNLMEPELNSVAETFAEAVFTCMSESLDPPSQQIMEFLCKANARLPDSNTVFIVLSRSFLHLFILTQSHEDYEGVMAPLEKLSPLIPQRRVPTNT